MGQKVNPTGIRLGIVKDHASVWYAERGAYADKLNNDLEVRSFLEERLKNASVSRIHIERPANNARITIHTARPGIVIGKKGEDVDRLRRDLTEMMGVPVHVNIEEVRKPELDAAGCANVAGQRASRYVPSCDEARGTKRNASWRWRHQDSAVGRLGGAEIARTEWYREGRVPLHTLRADIDYATYEAHTTYGVIGVKVWIFKGEILGGIEEVRAKAKQQQPAGNAPKKKGSR